MVSFILVRIMSLVGMFEILLCFVLLLHETNICFARSCDENDVECHGSLEVPLLSIYSAPLKADLDLSELTKQMTKLIKTKIKESVAAILPEVVDSIVGIKMNILEEKLDKIMKVTGLLQDRYDNISNKLENVTGYVEENVSGELLTLGRKVEKVVEVTKTFRERVDNVTKKTEAITKIIESVTTDRLEDVEGKVKTLVKLTSNLQDSFDMINEETKFGTKERSDGNSEKEYVTVFTEPYPNRAEPTLYMYSSSEGRVMIQSEGKIHNLTIKRGENKKIVSRNIFLDDSGVSNKVIRITSDVPIRVYGFQRHSGSCDGYFAIATRFLSRDYVVPSFTVWTNRKLSKSVIGIASLSKRTTVAVHVKTSSGSVRFKGKHYGNGGIITIMLLPYQSVQLSHVYDLSGSIISASEPVAVVCGNKCNSVTHELCNHFTEYVIPAEQLDTEFIIPAISDTTKSTIRLLTYESNSIFISGKEDKHITLENAEFHDIEHTDLTYVKSERGLLVMMYPHERVGDSFMMTIHGVNQYKSRYDFIVPEGFSSHISVAMLGRCDSCKDFILDEKDISFIHAKTKSINGMEYCTLSHDITSGSHSLRNKYSTKFGLWLYGHLLSDGYGYPAGISFI